MNRFLFLILCFIPFYLISEIEFNAQKISFKGKKIELQKDVSIQNEMGTIHSEEAIIFKEISRKNPYKIYLKENVLINVKNLCDIDCDGGNIDFIHRHAELFSNSINHLILTNFKKKFHSHSIPNIRTTKLLINFEENFEITSIKAKESVIIEDSYYTIYGNEGELTFQNNFEVIPGKIILSENKIIKNATIHCSKINLNISERKINFLNVEATLIDKDDHLMTLKADKVIYDEMDEKLELLGSIEINHPFFYILNDSEIQLHLNKENIEKIHFVGETTFRYLNEKGYSLISDGDLILDTKNMRLYGLKKQQQIRIEDEIGLIFGNSLTIEYGKEKEKYLLKKIILEDEIKLINGVKEKNQRLPLKYALADKMELSLKTKKLNLSSKNLNSVLFYDPINNIKISAQGIEYDQGKFSGKGNVRFHFLSKEFDEIRTKFNL